MFGKTHMWNEAVRKLASHPKPQIVSIFFPLSLNSSPLLLQYNPYINPIFLTSVQTSEQLAEKSCREAFIRLPHLHLFGKSQL